MAFEFHSTAKWAAKLGIEKSIVPEKRVPVSTIDNGAFLSRLDFKFVKIGFSSNVA
jgi:hypothetical protein